MEISVKLSQRTALAISLSVIVLHWIYQIIAQRHGPQLPARFSDFVLRIAILKSVTLAAIVLLLRMQGEGPGRLGVTRADWPRRLGLGLAIGLAMFVGLNVLLDSIMNSLLPRPAGPRPRRLGFFRSPRNLVAWLPIGILGGGIVEELERIFVLTRFEAWLGRPGLVLGVVLSSAMFGYGHLYQGLGTAIATMISGAIFSFVYLRRRSALEPIAAHAFSDVLAVLAATMLVH
jgi:membrane protease YdiL (CAAX protease family)